MLNYLHDEHNKHRRYLAHQWWAFERAKPSTAEEGWPNMDDHIINEFKCITIDINKDLKTTPMSNQTSITIQETGAMSIPLPLEQILLLNLPHKPPSLGLFNHKLDRLSSAVRGHGHTFRFPSVCGVRLPLRLWCCSVCSTGSVSPLRRRPPSGATIIHSGSPLSVVWCYSVCSHRFRVSLRGQGPRSYIVVPFCPVLRCLVLPAPCLPLRSGATIIHCGSPLSGVALSGPAGSVSPSAVRGHDHTLWFPSVRCCAVWSCRLRVSLRGQGPRSHIVVPLCLRCPIASAPLSGLRRLLLPVPCLPPPSGATITHSGGRRIV
jgi:hypothetical protein